MIDDFADKWGPVRAWGYKEFVKELRALLEAAVIHESGHEHGEEL
jgi:hypothetical protein